MPTLTAIRVRLPIDASEFRGKVRSGRRVQHSSDGGAVKKLESSAIPLLASLLHHCKEGWPSDSENIAKHPLIARPGWFSDESKRKTTPAASASVASPNFL